MNPEDNAGGLTYLNTSREKIDPGLNSRDAYSSRLWRRRINRYRNLGIVQIDSVERRFLLEQISVINVQGKITDLGKDRLPAAAIVDFEIFCYQASERVERETPHPDLQAETVEFLCEQRPPMSSKSFMIGIVGGPGEQESQHQRVSHLKNWMIGRIGIEPAGKIRIQSNRAMEIACPRTERLALEFAELCFQIGTAYAM